MAKWLFLFKFDVLIQSKAYVTLICIIISTVERRMDMIVEPIGIVKSPVTEGIDENWGSVISEGK